MHEKTRVFRVKKGEKCLKPLAHHTFIPPGENGMADCDCLIVIPHCSENHGVIISDEYLQELGYYFKNKKEYKAGDIYENWNTLPHINPDTHIEIGNLLVWAHYIFEGVIKEGEIVKVASMDREGWIDNSGREWVVNTPFAFLPKE